MKDVQKAIERHEYFSNFFHRINGASVKISNVIELDERYYYTATLTNSDSGEKNIYHDCYLEKEFVQSLIKSGGK